MDEELGRLWDLMASSDGLQPQEAWTVMGRTPSLVVACGWELFYLHVGTLGIQLRHV